MSKVIKSFSLDMETVHMLEQYCQQEEVSFGGTAMVSRSKLVNDAIQWFLRGDTAELVHSNERLMEAVKRANKHIMSPTPISRPWWRRLLLGR